MADDEVKLLADAKKLPLADRVAHSNWKARSAVYEDIAAGCKAIFDDSDPKLAEYGA
jgi:cytoskeleton-associated protein 5